MSMLDGLKAIAGELERLATVRGFKLVEVTTASAWKLSKRRNDPLPTYKVRGKGGGRKADRVSVEAWFIRQRFAFYSDEQSPHG